MYSCIYAVVTGYRVGVYTVCVSGYVPLSNTKIDFSSDLEKTDPAQKKKKKRVRQYLHFTQSVLS